MFNPILLQYFDHMSMHRTSQGRKMLQKQADQQYYSNKHLHQAANVQEYRTQQLHDQRLVLLVQINHR
jgi:hypothetical protein